MTEFKNVAFFGFEHGIRSTGSEPVIAENVIFVNVNNPVDIRGAAISELTNVTVAHSFDYRSGSPSPFRPGYPPLPVFCPSCRAVAPSSNFFFSATLAELWGNTEPCRVCGYAEAKLSDGLFDLTGDIVEIISSPELSHFSLRTLNYIADQTLNGKIEPAEAISKAASINAKLGRILSAAWSRGHSVFYFAVGCVAFASFYVSIQSLDQSYIQTQLSQEQTKIAIEQLRLQKEASPSADATTLCTLQSLSAYCFQLKITNQEPTADRRESPSRNPSAGEAHTKASSSELRMGHKGGNRGAQRKAMRQRRIMLGGARHA